MLIYLIYNDPGTGSSAPVFLQYSQENLSLIPEDTHYLLDGFSELGHKVYFFNPNDSVQSLITTLTEYKPDFIFNLVEYFRGTQKKEMNIAGLFEMLNIPYSGAGSVTLANANNKILCKQLFINENISTPAFFVANSVTDCSTHTLSFPLIAKPAFDDGSGGIDNGSVVENDEQLLLRVRLLLEEYKQPALIEEFINGREFNVAMIEMNGKPVCLPVSEIDFSTMPNHLNKIVSFQAKWDPTHESFYKTVPVCPAFISEELTQSLYSLANMAWETIGMRGYARVDIRVDNEGKAFVLEINPNPDISPDAGFLRATTAAGISLSETLNLIIQAAVNK